MSPWMTSRQSTIVYRLPIDREERPLDRTHHTKPCPFIEHTTAVTRTSVTTTLFLLVKFAKFSHF
jgi:hypothetical protein